MGDPLGGVEKIKMFVDIPYGGKKIRIKITEKYEVLTPNKVRVKDENEIITQGLRNPIDKESLEEFVANAKQLLVIVNDATRPTPTAKILKHLYPIISSHPNIKFLIATGIHRAPTQKEYRFIFGDLYKKFQNRIYSHDARKDEDMIYLGRSKNGTEMYINKMVPETKNILVIGSVEPHYFAGYTGGRKSFLPGVASYKTIEMNHKLALDNNASPLSLKENPVNIDMIDAMNVLKNINVFSIQTILTGDHKIYAVTSGDLTRSFEIAIKYANEIFCVPLKEKGNIVITVAPYPMDIDLYQSQKALENGKLALQEDGIIILVSKCRAGIGEKTFLELLSKADTPQKVFEIISRGYKLGYHKAARIAQLKTWAEIWAVTSLNDKIIRKTMMKPYKDIQSAVDDAIKTIKTKGKQPKIIILPSGSLTVPYIR